MAPPIGDPDGWRDRLRRAAAWLDASPAELVSLAVLLAGGVAATATLAGLTPGATAAAPPGPPVASLLETPAVLVHVTGAVARPGVVELPDGSRVADAVAAAGGATPDADLTAVNLARPVGDGEHLLVPPRGSGPGGTPAPTSPVHLPDGRLDLNAADADDLESLPGIGPVLASRIVDHRGRDGPFTAVEQLRDVPGIGEKLLGDLAELVGVR